MGGDPGRGQRDALPGRGAPKTGSPGPAHPDFYLHGRACLMRVGGGGGGELMRELHSRAGYLTFHWSSQLIIAWPAQAWTTRLP